MKSRQSLPCLADVKRASEAWLGRRGELQSPAGRRGEPQSPAGRRGAYETVQIEMNTHFGLRGPLSTDLHASVVINPNY